MAMQSPYRVVLTDADRSVLSARAHAGRAAHRDVVRARIVLAAADEEPNAQIARRLNLCEDTVRKWRARFCAEGLAGLAGLADRPRPGRRRTFAKTAEAEIKALACELPAESAVPLARWSHAELAAEAVTRGVVEAISPSTVGRWLRADAIRPWRYRSWIFPRDPDFAVKAARVLDLYDRLWAGQPLGDDEYVLSADEKSQLQALRRRHPDLPPAPGRHRRTEFEYRRGGTLAYLAAYDVHAARVIGRCAPTTGITPFGALVEQVMTTEPYASARRVFWIVDNGSSHNGVRSIERMRATWPTAELVHLPIHASWLNQVEIFFSIVGRKVIKPGDFADLEELVERLLAFQDRYNAAAEPFNWRFGRKSLDRLLKRLAIHEPLAA
jgi:transposase